MSVEKLTTGISDDRAIQQLQQLKDEIAALANKIDKAWTECDFNEHRRLTNVMRQLSAGR
jgi:hypothetical protein